MMGMVISVLKHYFRNDYLDVRMCYWDLDNDGDIDVLSVPKMIIKCN
jgi:hypothetical protein